MTWIFLQISENTTLNKFRKSVNICQSYARMYSGTVYSVFDSLCRKGGSCDALPIESRPMSRQSPVVPGFYYDAHNARHQPTLQIGHWLPLDSATSISTVVRIFWRLVAVSICRFRFWPILIGMYLCSLHLPHILHLNRTTPGSYEVMSIFEDSDHRVTNLLPPSRLVMALAHQRPNKSAITCSHWLRQTHGPGCSCTSGSASLRHNTGSGQLSSWRRPRGRPRKCCLEQIGSLPGARIGRHRWRHPTTRRVRRSTVRDKDRLI